MAFKHTVFATSLITSMIALSPPVALADNGLIAKTSKHSVEDTIVKFENAIKEKADAGWVVFTKIDHAAAAKDAGLTMRPRTIIIFGNPKGGTPSMVQAPTLAIDLPMKALVWQDDQGAVWLSYNASAYGTKVVYARHGLNVSDEATARLEKFLTEVSDHATQ